MSLFDECQPGLHDPRPRHWIGYRVNQATLIHIHRAILAMALVGLFASLYLFITYVSGKPIACGPLQGCELVRASKWAYTFGFPRPALGVLFYTAIIVLLAFRAYAPHWRPLVWRTSLLIATTIGLIESGFLTLVQWFDIRAFCIWCLTSAATATAIFILSLFDGREPASRGSIAKELQFVFYAFVFASLLGATALWLLLGRAAGGEIPRFLAA